MKKLLSLFLLMALGLSLHSCKGRAADTPEELAENIIEALRKDKYEVYKYYFASLNDNRELAKAGGMSRRRQKRMVQRFIMRKREYNERIKASYNDIRSQGKALGIDWSKVEYIRCSYDKDPLFNLERMDWIIVEFRCKDIIYELRLDDCFKLKRGWIMTDQPRGPEVK